MKPERWQEVEKIYDAALELDERHRGRFLESACDGDEQLKREVESLLRQEGENVDSPESPALEVVAQGLARDKADSLIGRQFDSYRTLSLLGTGGMGEVYLAEDRRLDRKVALKFLPEELRQDDTARKRFLREAKSAAALDHPYVCKIYEVGEADGKDFLAMEYLAGETLGARLARGPLPLKEALPKAIEIAEALEAARQRKIVHRDLKPANVMLTPDGHVKVMDFGLAKRVGGDGLGQDAMATLTRPGTTVGTMAYMSPEQLRRVEVDPRSDIFSFGIVLYEMLTGVHPFMNPEPVEIVSNILKEDPPPLTRYVRDVPPVLEHTVTKMLAKDRSRRYQLIHEVGTDLRDVMDGIALPSPTPNDSLAPPVPKPEPLTEPAWRGMIPWGVAGVLGLALWISLVAPWQTSPQAEQTPLRLRVELSPERPLQLLADSAAVFSPDGQRIAYVTSGGIEVRALNQLEATRVTEGGQDPFFSPDGQWVGFEDQGLLQKVPVSGGAAVTLCEVPDNRGSTWGPDETIIFNPGGTTGLWRVPALGGIPEEITVLDEEKGEESHRYPQFLPGGKWVLFTAKLSASADEANIMVHSLETGERKVVHQGGYHARYVPTGHLVFVRERTLVAVPFDLDRLAVTGSPVPILHGVLSDAGQGEAHFAFSESGNLVYVPEAGVQQNSIVYLDREGHEEPYRAEARAYRWPRFSPDGRRLAVAVMEQGNRDVWIHGLARETRTRLTFDSARDGDDGQVWTPDGQRVVFSSNREGGVYNLFWKAADGTGRVERLTTSPNRQYPSSFSPDGKSLVFGEYKGGSGADIHLLSMEGEHTSQPLIQTEFDEGFPRTSPDGRWIAYHSSESGQFEVYVRPFPNVEDGKSVISTDGGVHPVWGPDGRELFYRSVPGGKDMMVVRVDTEPIFAAGTPKLLFTTRWASNLFTYPYDIAPNGRRFVIVKPEDRSISARTHVNIVLNWFEELKRLVPTGE